MSSKEGYTVKVVNLEAICLAFRPVLGTSIVARIILPALSWETPEVNLKYIDNSVNICLTSYFYALL